MEDAALSAYKLQCLQLAASQGGGLKEIMESASHYASFVLGNYFLTKDEPEGEAHEPVEGGSVMSAHDHVIERLRKDYAYALGSAADKQGEAERGKELVSRAEESAQRNLKWAEDLRAAILALGGTEPERMTIPMYALNSAQQRVNETFNTQIATNNKVNAA